MSQFEFTITEQPQELLLYGISMLSGRRSAHIDRQTMAGLYRNIIGEAASAQPLWTVVSDFDETSQTFSLFVGGEKPHGALSALPLPEGAYARTVSRPSFRLTAARNAEKAARAFYREWLPASGYTALPLFYERQGDSGDTDAPQSLCFALLPKA